MTHNCAFSITLTTLALYQSSLWLFEACSCKPAPRLIYCAASAYRFYGTLIPVLPPPVILVSEHWDDTVCYANYLLIAMFVQLCVTRWNDKVMGVTQVAGTGIQNTTLAINI